MSKKKYSALSLLAAVTVAAVIGCMVGQGRSSGDRVTEAAPAQEPQETNPGGGPQFDAPYYTLLDRNKETRAAEDRQIEQKLEALRRRFGKKPNIIYILADDVGWGEMGWQVPLISCTSPGLSS